MSKIKKYLFIVGVLLAGIASSFGATSSLEEPLPFPNFGLKRSPADAIQRLGASALVVPDDLAESFPIRIDLNPYLKKYPVRDQGPIGSCASHAGALTFMERSAVIGAPIFDPSILGLYYLARAETGMTQEDAGSSLYDVWQVLKRTGLSEEKFWPYIPEKFAEKPPADAYASAAHHKVVDDLGICWVGNELKNIKAALANNFSVAVGMALYESFDKAEGTGRIPVPAKGEKRKSNHAMVFNGYDDGYANMDGTYGALFLENSYGPFWGDKVGRGARLYLPYSFLDRNNPVFKESGCPIFEAWTIHRVSGAPEAAEALRYGVSFGRTGELIPQEEGF